MVPNKVLMGIPRTMRERRSVDGKETMRNDQIASNSFHESAQIYKRRVEREGRKRDNEQ